MAKFTDANALKKHIKEALDALQTKVLVTTQAELGSEAVSPVDTGRFRSSWFAAEGNSSGAVAPEGANSANTDAAGLKVDSEKDYHLTNNLPYAQRLCVEGRVVSKSPGWFKEFRDQTIPEIQAQAVRQVKSEFDL